MRIRCSCCCVVSPVGKIPANCLYHTPTGYSQVKNPSETKMFEDSLVTWMSRLPNRDPFRPSPWQQSRGVQDESQFRRDVDERCK